MDPSWKCRERQIAPCRKVPIRLEPAWLTLLLNIQSPGLSREVDDAVPKLRPTKEGNHHDDGVNHTENEANVYAGVS